MKTLSEGDLHGLVRLLGDDDNWTYQIARNTLLEFGEAARPYLEAGCHHADAAVRERAEQLLASFGWERYRWEWQHFAMQPEHDLEEGLLLIARFAETNLDGAAVKAQLDQMASELRTFLRPGEEVNVAAPTLARFFSERHGFLGNTEDYENPDNSFIHSVLSTRKGLPILLSCIYILVSRRVGLPVSGVGMPGRFLVRYGGAEGTHIFLDPFHGTRLLSTQSCLRWLNSHGYQADLKALATTPDRLILARVLANLHNHYQKRNERVLAERVREMREALLAER